MLFYDMVHAKTFTNQLLALPPKEIPQILEKAEVLSVAPAPDAKNKKRLYGYKRPIYRIRAGDYRIIYAFGNSWVKLLGVDHRKDVYKGDLLVADDIFVDLTELPADEVLLAAEPHSHYPHPSYVPEVPSGIVPDDAGTMSVLDGQCNTTAATPLPRPLDHTFLEQLRVPPTAIAELSRCNTLEDLIDAQISDELRAQIFDALFVPNYDVVYEESGFRVDSIDDYRRFLSGDLTTFLLHLDPEQERFVNWGISGSGPTLLKGAPGTGKSIVAIYRARSLVRAL